MKYIRLFMIIIFLWTLFTDDFNNGHSNFSIIDIKKSENYNDLLAYRNDITSEDYKNIYEPIYYDINQNIGLNPKCGYESIDKELIIDYKFERCTNVINEYAVVNRNNNYYLIDMKGNIIYEFPNNRDYIEIDELIDYHDNKLYVSWYKGSSIIDTENDNVINFKGKFIDTNYNGIFSMLNTNGGINIVDKYGNKIDDRNFRYVSFYGNDNVELEDSDGYIYAEIIERKQ